MDEIMKDEKVQQVLTMLADGKSREEVGEYYGQNFSSVDMYMRRRGFRWDKENATFVLKEKESSTSLSQKVKTLNTKAAQIIRMLDVKHPNIRQVASKQGFESVEAMGEYMKSQGYIWDHEIENYCEDPASNKGAGSSSAALLIPSGSTGPLDESNLLPFLLAHQERLMDLLQSGHDGKVPTYTFKGTKVQKTLGIASSVDTLMSDYSKEFNITQRAILETALAEFFQKYGYDEQLQQVIT
ncbi:hypothetical protein [Sporosarcina sp. P33]|uniref:hypothetical protein n=1 Tax=Sporosarcina sp. P33 TaxID=1930764 RepID=UPI0009BD4158|nr:hypothetical protein [Sporosarcina sp. P33]ARD48846.1 hypothetical protein SporoP33_11830 [Sporosarcina sp. P33]